MDRIDEIPYALVPIGLVVGMFVGLILLEPDLGTSITLMLIAAAMVSILISQAIPAGTVASETSLVPAPER